MKPKHLFLCLAAVLVAGGLWLARSTWQTRPVHESTQEVDRQTPGSRPRQMLRPPDPNRKFQNLTPEERVRLARQGPIGG